MYEIAYAYHALVMTTNDLLGADLSRENETHET